MGMTSYIFLSLFQFLCQTKNNSIDRMIKNKQGSFHNIAVYFIICLPGGMTSDRSGCMKDFSLNTCFFNQNKSTAMVGFHRKIVTSIEAVIELNRLLFFN